MSTNQFVRCLVDIPRISLVAPLTYQQLVHFFKRAYLVLTDSGGLQEEAPAFGVPVLVLREITERPEAVQAGAAKLVGTNQEAIVEATNRLLNDEKAYQAMAQTVIRSVMGMQANGSWKP